MIKEYKKSLILETGNKIEKTSEINNNEKSTNSKNMDNIIDFSKCSSSNAFSPKSIEQNNILNTKKEEAKNNNSKKKIVKHISLPLHLNYKEEKPKGSTTSFPNLERSIANKSEHLFFPIFTNLTTSYEKSFDLISSYENINKITNNIYMKNTILQSKTKQFLIKECYTLSYDSTNEKMSINKKNLNGKVINNKNENTRRLTDDFQKEEEVNQSVNSLDISKIKSQKNNENKIENLSNKDKTHLKTKIKKYESIRNLPGKLHSKYNIVEILNKTQSKTNKKRRESELLSVNEKLNTITKNIKGANKNINNPDEFYMDFFNNIIKKETRVLDKSIDKGNNNKNSKAFSPKRKLNIDKNSPVHNKCHSIISSDEAKKKYIKIHKSNMQLQS